MAAAGLTIRSSGRLTAPLNSNVRDGEIQMTADSLSDIQATVANQLQLVGARLNQAQSKLLPGYWALDFVLEGHRYRLSSFEGKLVVERPTPAMQSGHAPDWYSLASTAITPSLDVAQQALALLEQARADRGR